MLVSGIFELKDNIFIYSDNIKNKILKNHNNIKVKYNGLIIGRIVKIFSFDSPIILEINGLEIINKKFYMNLNGFITESHFSNEGTVIDEIELDCIVLMEVE